MDLLPATDIILALCAPHPNDPEAAAALARCTADGGRVWLPAGAALFWREQWASAFRALTPPPNPATPPPSRPDRADRAAGETLARFAEGKQWLAALAGDGPLIGEHDAETALLLAALGRLPAGRARILTRNQSLLVHHPEHTITPADVLVRPGAPAAMDFIDLAAQQDGLRGALEAGLHRVLHHGRYILGPEVGELEARLAEYVGVKHAIGLSSGTDALLVALLALGVGPGDEVITSPFTFVATAEVIALLGAVPVFVDIDPSTYNLDPALVEARITPRTRVILPVSLYGQCADLEAINAIAARHGLPVLEDAAQSFGATRHGRRSGGLCTIGATSFFPSKPLGGYGDGGACFTDDDALATAMRQIMNHGQDRRYSHPRLGINGRLDTLQAAVLLAKLPLFDAEVARRATLGAAYSEQFLARGATWSGRPSDGIQVPAVAPGNTSVYAQYTLQVPDRDAVAARLTAAGIPSAVHYPLPLNRQGAYARFCCPDCTPLAQRAAERVISLPMHPHLRPAQQARVVAAVLGEPLPVDDPPGATGWQPVGLSAGR